MYAELKFIRPVIIGLAILIIADLVIAAMTYQKIDQVITGLLVGLAIGLGIYLYRISKLSIVCGLGSHGRMHSAPSQGGTP
jgi:hypothetical protein